MEHRQAPATDSDGLVAGPHSLEQQRAVIEGADEGQRDELRHEFNLVLTDDPAFSRGHGITNDVVDVLEQWRQHIVDLVVFPRVFTIMSQAESRA